MKENINNNFEKLIPKKAVIEPSFENSLLAFKYSSIAKKEQKEKTKILEAEKNSFQLIINMIRAQWDNTLSTRDLHKLDSSQKNELLSYQYEWKNTLCYVDFLEREIKDTTNALLDAFQGEESGELHCSKYAMIKQDGFPSVCNNKSGFVPEVIPGHLFYLLNLFCLLSTCAMNAVKIQYRVVALFDNKAQNIEDLLRKELNPFSDLASILSREMESIRKGLEQTVVNTERTNKKQNEIKDSQEKLKELIINRNEIDAEKTGTLSIEQCVLIVGQIKRHYVDLKKRDCRSIGIPPETVGKVNEKTIRRYVEYWDQYLKGNKKQGRKPPRKDYSRNMSKEDYARLINDVELDKYNKWRARNRIYERERKYPSTSKNEGDSKSV